MSDNIRVSKQKERNIVVETVRIRNHAEDRKFHSALAELFMILFLDRVRDFRFVPPCPPPLL